MGTKAGGCRRPLLKIADIARGSVCVTAMGIDGGRGLRHEIDGFVTQCTWNAKSPTKPPVTQEVRVEYDSFYFEG